LWSRQFSNFGGLRLAWSWELFGRLNAWAYLWEISLGNWFIIGLVLVSVFILGYRAFREGDEAGAHDLLLILFICSYLVLHWILAVPVWDRYLLPLLPFVAILLARGCSMIYRGIEHFLNRSFGAKTANVKAIVPTLFFLLFLVIYWPAVFEAHEGIRPIGGQPVSDQGAWQIAEYLSDEPYGTVLYDHWYSWQWQYHLLDKKVFVSWFPYPEALVEDLQVFGNSPGRRLIILPATIAAQPVIRAIIGAGFDLKQVVKTDYEPGLILYQIDGEGGPR